MKLKKPLQILGCLWGLIGLAGASHAQSVPAGRQPVVEAANALGGLAKVNATRNITLYGYGMSAYGFGGGNITGGPNAPQKYIAENDLRRVYDLENNRFQQLERRNMLFPFAGAGGHDYALQNLVLDGDIAFETRRDGVVIRSPRWTEGFHFQDGVHMRRMWGLNNPVALVRAALKPETQVSNVRTANGETVLDLVLQEGDKLSMGITQSTKLPAWVRWSNPHNNLGEVTFTTYFEGFTPFSGLLLPLGYKTVLDYRNVEYFKIYVDTYQVDTQIADLRAPDSVRNVNDARPPEPQIQARQLGKGIWRLTPGGTTVFEFADHLLLYELGGSPARGKAIIDFANTLVPGKRATELVISHTHFDHTSGFRAAVAEGLTVISLPENEGILRDMATWRAPNFPDILERNRQPLKFRPMGEHLRLQDSAMTLDLYWGRTNNHMAHSVFAYAPEQKVMAEGDIATAAFDYQWWPDAYMDAIEHYKLDVETLSPVHMDVMKQAEVIELIKGGVQRARERCAAELAKGNYFPGCPVQSLRY
jgi:glyoxylase-like metal-dependent hydrolase (beta-lactamase superfamily II)